MNEPKHFGTRIPTANKQIVKYSIIIPHYDIPQLLARCVASIPIREDIQVIVVDDCSPGADSYLEKYPFLSRPYLEFYSTDQGGSAGRARNVGLDHAKGVWLLFADADDFFCDCFSEILDEYVGAMEDVVFFNASSVDSETYLPSTRSKQLNSFVGQYETNKQLSVFNLKFIFGEPWSKLVKRELVERHRIRFDETIIHNDTTFSYLVGYYCNSVAVDRRKAYCITNRKQSISGGVLSNEQIHIRVEVFSRKYQFLKTKGIIVLEKRYIFPSIVRLILKRDFKNAIDCIRIVRQSGLGFMYTVLYVIESYKDYLKKTVRKKVPSLCKNF